MRMRSVDRSGGPAHSVKEVRLEERADGWVVTHLVVGRAGVTERFGFIHGIVERPAVIAKLMRRLARHARVVPIDKVEFSGDQVEVSAEWRELDRPEGYR